MKLNVTKNEPVVVSVPNDAAGNLTTLSALDDFEKQQAIMVAGVPNIVRFGINALSVSLVRVRTALPGHTRNHLYRFTALPGKSVFKKPKDVKLIIERSINEALIGLKKNGDGMVSGDVVSYGNTTVVQEGERLVIFRKIGKIIGTQGEDGIKIVVTKSGNIVTAFPIKIAAAGTILGVSGVSAAKAQAVEADFNSRVVNAIHHVDQTTRRENRFDLTNEVLGVLDPTGILNATPGNSGEQAWLDVRNRGQEAVRSTERLLGRTLSPAEHNNLLDNFFKAVQGAAFGFTENRPNS